MLEYIIAFIIFIMVFSFSIYIVQVIAIIIDLCMRDYSIFSKKQTKFMFIPFGFILILVEKYRNKGEE